MAANPAAWLRRSQSASESLLPTWQRPQPTPPPPSPPPPSPPTPHSPPPATPPTPPPPQPGIWACIKTVVAAFMFGTRLAVMRHSMGGISFVVSAYADLLFKKVAPNWVVPLLVGVVMLLPVMICLYSPGDNKRDTILQEGFGPWRWFLDIKRRYKRLRGEKDSLPV